MTAGATRRLPVGLKKQQESPSIAMGFLLCGDIGNAGVAVLHVRLLFRQTSQVNHENRSLCRNVFARSTPRGSNISMAGPVPERHNPACDVAHIHNLRGTRDRGDDVAAITRLHRLDFRGGGVKQKPTARHW